MREEEASGALEVERAAARCSRDASRPLQTSGMRRGRRWPTRQGLAGDGVASLTGRWSRGKARERQRRRGRPWMLLRASWTRQGAGERHPDEAENARGGRLAGGLDPDGSGAWCPSGCCTRAARVARRGGCRRWRGGPSWGSGWLGWIGLVGKTRWSSGCGGWWDGDPELGDETGGG